MMLLFILILLANSPFVLALPTGRSTFIPTTNEAETSTMSTILSGSSQSIMPIDTTVTTTEPTTTESPATTIPETTKTTEIIKKTVVLDITEPTSTLTVEIIEKEPTEEQNSNEAKSNEAATSSNNEDSSDTLTGILIVGSLLLVILLILVVLGGWKYKTYKDKKEKDEKKKESVDAQLLARDTAAVENAAKLRKKQSHGKKVKLSGRKGPVLRTFEDTAIVLPDKDFQNKGVLVMTNAEGPLVHATDGLKSREIEQLVYDPTLNMKREIGSEKEIYKGSAENPQQGTKEIKKKGNQDELEPYQRNDGTNKADAEQYQKDAVKKMLFTV